MRTIPRLIRLGATLAIGLPLAAVAQPSEPIPRGQVMANSCLSCHGAEGTGPGPMPSIREYTQQGLINRMLAFKRGAGEATIMHRHARGYSEAEIREMAAYLGQLKRGSDHD
jgi:cytochrome c553